MNGLAIIIGYTVIWLVVALIIAVPVGKFIAHRTDPGSAPQFESPDLSARPPFGGYSDPDPVQGQRQSRYLPPSQRFSDDDLRDPTPHEPAP